MFRSTLCVVICCTVSAISHADNGYISSASALNNINIDGDLSDWPDTLTKTPIHNNASREIVPGDEGFSASFMAAYSAEEQALYLALEVVDDVHSVPLESEPSTDSEAGTASDPEWTAHDSVIAYVDFNHSIKGSGSALYLVVGEHRGMLSGEGSWDADAAQADWSNAEAVVRRGEGATTYEWRIASHKPLQGNTSIGLDFLIADYDQPGEDVSATLYSWGPGFGKSQAGGRLADLLLIESDTESGQIEGQIKIALNSEDSSTPGAGLRVRITSKDNPDLWVQTRSDESGHYEATLPAGDYLISSVDRMRDREGDTPQVMAPAQPGAATIIANATATAATLVLQNVATPLTLPARGALFTFDAKSEAALNDVITTLMDHYQIPGASVALVKDGEMVFHNTFGVSNAFSGEPVKDDTLFEAASITKAVFAFAVMRLAERGVIDLDKPLYTYLPFEDIAHDPRYKKITARMVLSHQSGFPNWRWMNDDGQLDIKFYPGIKYGYSGEGFEYLGRVIAHLTGKPLEDVVIEEAAVPLGFASNTFFSDHPALYKQASRGHLAGMTGPHGFPSDIGVAHSMYTEAGTFSSFMLGLLAQKGLSEEWYANLLEPQVEVPLSDAEQPRWPGRYGLGLYLRNSPYGLAYGHGGNNLNFTCQFEVYPDHDMGFAVFTNAGTGYLLANALREYLIIGDNRVPENATAAN